MMTGWGGFVIRWVLLSSLAILFLSCHSGVEARYGPNQNRNDKREVHFNRPSQRETLLLAQPSHDFGPLGEKYARTLRGAYLAQQRFKGLSGQLDENDRRKQALKMADKARDKVKERERQSHLRHEVDSPPMVVLEDSENLQKKNKKKKNKNGAGGIEDPDDPNPAVVVGSGLSNSGVKNGIIDSGIAGGEQAIKDKSEDPSKKGDGEINFQQFFPRDVEGKRNLGGRRFRKRVVAITAAKAPPSAEDGTKTS